MQTLLEQLGRPTASLVKAVGGLPGIGGPGECGGVVSPLMVFALLDPPPPEPIGEPKSIRQGRVYLRRFQEVHGSVLCEDIGTDCLRCCYQAVVLSPLLFDEVANGPEKTPDEDRTNGSYTMLSTTMDRAQFHCAYSVLDGLRDKVPVTEEMRAAAAIFIGGMALSGSTCGALTAGAMAMSAQVSGIERSRWRTLKMLATMAVNVKWALRDSMNAFNPALRTTANLTRWFGKEFGSTRCAKLTNVDFSSPDSVRHFCASSGIEDCRERARRVVVRVREMLVAEERAHLPIE
jgi:hypothetical protein